MDEAFARELESFPWLRACGLTLNIDLPFPASQVGGWAQAMERCADTSWENVTLEARNRLTVFLHANHRGDYRNWNTIVEAAKKRVVTRLAEGVWRPFAEQNGLGKVLVDCVSWDVLAAIMEHEYRHCPGRPEFFLHLLRVYRDGHFPCDWVGEWPAGHLLVW